MIKSLLYSCLLALSSSTASYIRSRLAFVSMDCSSTLKLKAREVFQSEHQNIKMQIKKADKGEDC